MASVRLVTMAPGFLSSPTLKLTVLPQAVTACYILPMPAEQTTAISAPQPTAKQLVARQQPLCPKGAKELLRCKRRIDFAALGYTLPRPHLASVARRNERERNRVKQVNQGFARLREHVPDGARNKKMSKVDTLKAAVTYIKTLQATLDSADAVSAMFLQQGAALLQDRPCMSSATSTGSLSPDSVPSNVGYTTDASTNSETTLNDIDLLDFVSWFQ